MMKITPAAALTAAALSVAGCASQRASDPNVIDLSQSCTTGTVERNAAGEVAGMHLVLSHQGADFAITLEEPGGARFDTVVTQRGKNQTLELGGEFFGSGAQSVRLTSRHMYKCPLGDLHASVGEVTVSALAPTVETPGTP